MLCRLFGPSPATPRQIEALLEKRAPLGEFAFCARASIQESAEYHWLLRDTISSFCKREDVAAWMMLKGFWLLRDLRVHKEKTLLQDWHESRGMLIRSNKLPIRLLDVFTEIVHAKAISSQADIDKIVDEVLVSRELWRDDYASDTYERVVKLAQQYRANASILKRINGGSAQADFLRAQQGGILAELKTLINHPRVSEALDYIAVNEWSLASATAASTALRLDAAVYDCPRLRRAPAVIPPAPPIADAALVPRPDETESSPRAAACGG